MQQGHNSYLRLYPDIDRKDLMRRSVQIGLYMTAYSVIYDQKISKDNYLKIYKIAYNVCHKTGSILSDTLSESHHLSFDQKKLDVAFRSHLSKHESKNDHLKHMGNQYDENKAVKEERLAIYNTIHNDKEWISKEAIEKVAHSLDLSLTKGQEHVDVVLTNLLYRAYKTELSHLSDENILLLSVNKALLVSKAVKDHSSEDLTANHLYDSYKKAMQTDVKDLEKNNFHQDHTNQDHQHVQSHLKRMENMFHKNMHRVHEHIYVQKRSFEIQEQQHHERMHQQQMHEQQRSQMQLHRSLDLER